MKMRIVLIGSIVLLTAIPVAAQDERPLISAVFIMDANGSDQRPLFLDPIRATGLAVSPDGARVAYSASGSQGPDIWVSDIDGTNAVNLTNTHAVMEFGPSWSPDGRHIAFITNASGNGEIYVMDAEGEDVFNLTNNPASDSSPAWSPNGKQIAFTSDRGGNGQIYLINTDGSGIQNVTLGFEEDVYNGGAAWSPDGNRIAYVAIVGIERHIYLINVTGDPPQALVTDTFSAGRPAWSPKGDRIAFSSSRDGGRDIFVINPGGQDAVNLTRGVGLNTHPTWTPDGQIVFATRRSPEELEGHYLGPREVITIIEEGGISFSTRSGDTPPFRLRRTNAAGEFEFIPLSRREGARMLRERGHFSAKLDELFEP